jgi:drug/metabolite transporter (DMT)-like permease
MRGVAYIGLANLLFAVGYSFVSATGSALSVWQLVLVRGIVFAVVLLPWAVRHPEIARGTNRRLLLLRGAVGTGMMLCLLAAVIMLPLSIATLTGKTTPLWELLILWLLFALRPLAAELMLVPIAVLGLVLILHPEGHMSIAALSYLGLGLGLGAGLLNSLELMTLNRARRSEHANAINPWYAGVAIVVTLPLAMAQPWPADLTIWAFAVAFCLCSLAGQSLLADGMRTVSPTIGSVGTLLVPVFATLIGWGVFGQVLSGLEVIGIAMVLVVGGLVTRMESGQRAALSAAPFRWQRAPR